MVKIERFEVVDRCLFWKEEKTLIVGDLHLGYEGYLNERGWSFPKTQMEETLDVFARILKKVGKLKKIILLGDVKHYVSGILNSEFSDFRDIMALFDKYLLKNGEVIITKGNHDGILEQVVEKYGNVRLVDFLIVKDVLFFHGHSRQFGKVEVYDKKIKLVVVGHFHPAVVIKDRKGSKKERYKCFLYGKLKQLKNEVIIVPSFFPLVEGTDVSSGLLNGVYDINNFEVYVVADKVYDFGRIKSFLRKL